MARQRGNVKWFDDKKGFGFIRRIDSGTDVFVHYSEVRGEGHRTLSDGELVEFEIAPSEKGSYAVDVIKL